MSFHTHPINGASFGLKIDFRKQKLSTIIDELESHPQQLIDWLCEGEGLLYLPACNEISDNPALLIRMSYLFGSEVEDYTHTLTTKNLVHKKERRILVLSNQAPSNRGAPPQPDPPLTEDGELPVQFPHRRGWHTDQSFRRPPPDISLFYAVTASPNGQGQTLYANGYAAYEALDSGLRKAIEDRDGIHALPWTGRSESDVRSGKPPVDLLPHQRPQLQPLVRVHPLTGRKAIYCCEDAQMDWRDGPIAKMTPGPNGDGAKLVYRLMSHYTQPTFTYTHEWKDGDLVIHDNRNVIHSATWYDSKKYVRHMWRTTVMGNPGPEYSGDVRSWLPPSGVDPTANLANQ